VRENFFFNSKKNVKKSMKIAGEKQDDFLKNGGKEGERY
jgi:hypothetical protein